VSPRLWQERIEDILNATEEIYDFLADLTFEQFRVDARTLKAVFADLMIIGEAAQHVPEEITGRYPEVPWALMRGMRNRLVHGYFGIDPRVVWDTCRQDLPGIIEPLKRMLDTDS
jgi:uncharacterized protein with HEPN domain